MKSEIKVFVLGDVSYVATEVELVLLLCYFAAENKGAAES